MVYKLLASISIMVFSFTAPAQTLTFSQALILGDTPSTVPANKVWKISSAYGVADGCLGNFNTDYGTIRYKITNSTAFQVNGIEIPVEYNLKTPEHYGASNCTGTSSLFNQAAFGSAVWSKVPSTTVFPMWIPAGTTVAAMGSTVKLSVLEFNIVP